MALKDLGFGGVGTSSYATLSTLIAEFAPERFRVAINNASPALASGAIRKEDADGEEWTHTLMPGSTHAVGWVRDYGRMPTPGNLPPTKIRAQPANVVARQAMGRAAFNTKLSDRGLAKLFDSSLKIVSEQAARHLARGIVGQAVSPQAGATWSGTAADSTVTVNFLDISLFRPGAAYDFLDTSQTKSFVVRCTAVTPAAVGSNSANVAGSASFINDVPNPATGNVVVLDNTTVATDDAFRLRGETLGFGGSNAVTGDAIISLDDVAGAGATSNLHGVGPSGVPGWAGQYTANVAAPYSQEFMIGFMGRIETLSGSRPDHVLMHPALAAAHMASAGFQGALYGVGALGLQASATRSIDRSMDKYGAYEGVDSGLRVGTARIVQDPSVPAGRVICLTKEELALVVWKELGADEEAGDPVLLRREEYGVEIQHSGQMQLCCYKRSAHGIAGGFTAL